MGGEGGPQKAARAGCAARRPACGAAAPALLPPAVPAVPRPALQLVWRAGPHPEGGREGGPQWAEAVDSMQVTDNESPFRLVCLSHAGACGVYLQHVEVHACVRMVASVWLPSREVQAVLQVFFNSFSVLAFCSLFLQFLLFFMLFSYCYHL